MKSRAWPVLALGFAGLIVVIAVFGFNAIHQARILHSETIAIQSNHLQNEECVRQISAQMFLAELLVRDYLLDSSPAVPAYREQLREIRASLEQRLDSLQQGMGTENYDAVYQLRSEVKAYFASLGPILEWTPAQKAVQDQAFLRRNMMLRRQSIVALAEEVTALSASSLNKERLRLESSQAQFQRFLRRMLAVCLLLGIVVAFAATYKFWSLDRQHKQIERTGEELRRLSRGLASAQEKERRSISRELHDAVGPLVTGVRLELANLDSSRSSPEEFRKHLEEARQLTAETLKLIQNLAMGLRPSMLDDFGLGPAVEWQGRELWRRSGIPVAVQIDGSLDQLPETHCTCIFRIIQEALTNCARHAQATNIRVSLYGREDFVEATIQDDGIGFNPEGFIHSGLGLIGMEERARELQGRVTVVSTPGKGTIVAVQLPVPAKVAA